MNFQQFEVRVEVPIGDSSRKIVNGGTKGDVVLESKPEKGVVRGKLYKRESILDEVNTQVATTLEENSATILNWSVGTFYDNGKLQDGKHSFQVQPTQFKYARTGLKSLPQLLIDQVILEISPQQSRIINGNLETTGLNTVIKGQFQEWIDLGGLSQIRDEQSSETAIRNISKQLGRRCEFIKIEKNIFLDH